MDRKRKIGFIILMTAFLALAIGTAVMNHEPAEKEAKPHATLADGRKLVLHAVTYGTNHSIKLADEPSNPWLSLLPRALRGSRSRTYRQTETHECVVPWLIVPRPPGSTASPDVGSLRVVTDSGGSMPTGGRSTSSLRNGNRLVRTTIQNYPRREEYFSLTGKVDRLPFSIRVKNPIFGRKFPSWTPQEMPATNTVGDYQFVLPSPELNVHDRGGYLSSRLKIFHRGRPVDDWFNRTLELSDPTGNRAYHLSTNETIWKTHHTIWKNFAAPWPTNDYRDFPLAKLPGAAGFELIMIKDVLGGIPFHRMWIGGPGSYEFHNGVLTNATVLAPGAGERWSRQSGSHGHSTKWARHEHWIIVELDRWPPRHQRVAIFVRDRTGREARVERRGSSGGRGVQTSAFLIKPAWADVIAARKDPKKPTALKDLLKPPLTIRVGLDTRMNTEFIIDITKLPRAK